MSVHSHPPVPEVFTVHRVLGEGSSAVVWLARYNVTGQQVALKVWRRRLDAPGQSRFTEQCHWHRLLSGHPNIVDWVWASEPDANYPWTATVPHGISLTSWLAEPHSFSARLQVACDIVNGLAAMHRHGLVHRDINPNNILVDTNDRAVLCDLGIAMPLTRMTVDTSAGTPGFVAPELSEADVTPSYVSDVYAMGRTLDAVLGHNLPEELEHLVVRATSQRPSDRPADAVELSLMLRTIARKYAHDEQNGVTVSQWEDAPGTRPDLDAVTRFNLDPVLQRVPVSSVPQPAALDASTVRLSSPSSSQGKRSRFWAGVVVGVFALTLVGTGFAVAKLSFAPKPPSVPLSPSSPLSSSGSPSTSSSPSISTSSSSPAVSSASSQPTSPSRPSSPSRQSGPTTPAAVVAAFNAQPDIASDNSPNTRNARNPGQCEGKVSARVPVKDSAGIGFGEVRITHDTAGQMCAKFVKNKDSTLYGKASFLAITLCNENGGCDHDWSNYKVDAGPVRTPVKNSCVYWRVSAQSDNKSTWLVRNLRGSAGC